MKNAIILHGMSGKEEYYDPKYPSPSNCHWYPWLQRQLQLVDIDAQTPEIPVSYDMQYEIWKRELERYDVTSNTLLVAHSAGGGFIVRWLSENPKAKVGKVILAAPWLNPDEDEFDTGTFFKFKIDPKIIDRTKSFVVFYSDTDYPDILKSVDMIKKIIPGGKYVELPDRGHFVDENGGIIEFPELLKECLA